MNTFTVEQHEQIAQKLGIESDALFAAFLGRERHEQRIQDTMDAARETASKMGVSPITILTFELLADHTDRLLPLGKGRRHASDGAAWMSAAIRAHDKLFSKALPSGECLLEVPCGEWDWDRRMVRVPKTVLRETPSLIQVLAKDEDEDIRSWRVPARKILRKMAESLAHWHSLTLRGLQDGANKLAPHFDPISAALIEAEEMAKDRPIEIGLIDAVEFAVRPQSKTLVFKGHFHFNSHNREEIPIGGEIQSNFFADWYGEENHEKVDPLLAEQGLQLTCPGKCNTEKLCEGCEFDGRWVLKELT